MGHGEGCDPASIKTSDDVLAARVETSGIQAQQVPICSECRNAVNSLSCAGLPIRYRCSGKQVVRATFRGAYASNTCCWPRHKRVLPRLPFRPSASPWGVCIAFPTSACQVGRVSGWRGSVNLKAPGHADDTGIHSVAAVSGRATVRKTVLVLKQETQSWKP